jgi:transcription elongation factor Elf1
MSKDVKCPYCKHYNNEPEENYGQDETYETECESCGKTFGVTVNWWPSYRSYETPCLNVDPEKHEYVKIVGYPVEYFKNKFRCKYCGVEKTINET